MLTLDLAVPFVQKRDAGRIPTRKKERITAGDLLSRAKVPVTYSTNLEGKTSRYIPKLE